MTISLLLLRARTLRFNARFPLLSKQLLGSASSIFPTSQVLFDSCATLAERHFELLSSLYRPLTSWHGNLVPNLFSRHCSPPRMSGTRSVFQVLAYSAFSIIPRYVLCLVCWGNLSVSWEETFESCVLVLGI
jgi:hypothetical protein